jgi:hypothetical protein
MIMIPRRFYPEATQYPRSEPKQAPNLPGSAHLTIHRVAGQIIVNALFDFPNHIRLGKGGSSYSLPNPMAAFLSSYERARRKKIAQ